MRGDADALATVTGIVDGTGSVGAAIGQVRWLVCHTYMNYTLQNGPSQGMSHIYCHW